MTMTAQRTDADLPAQLRPLFARSQDQPEAIREALQAALLVAAPDATPEQVLLDTFGQLGYLPDETKQEATKLLQTPSD